MSSGHLVLRQAVDQIRNPHPLRRDVGDIQALADSILQLGLLHPIVLTPAGELILGERALAAVKLLGWREVPVWIATGITDQVRLLTAREHDHRLTKPLNPIEEAELYAELKTHYNEYTKARQLASRFGAAAGMDGAGDSPAPQRSNVLAARAVTGRDSHQAHERVLKVMALAGDPGVPERLRAEAAQAIERMRSTGTVTEPYADVVAAQARHHLEQLARHPETAPGARAAITGLDHAPTAVERIRRAHQTLTPLGTADQGWADIDPRFRAQSAVRRLRSGLEHSERWWEGIDPADIEDLPGDIAASLVAYHDSIAAFLTALDLHPDPSGAAQRT